MRRRSLWSDGVVTLAGLVVAALPAAEAKEKRGPGAARPAMFHEDRQNPMHPKISSQMDGSLAVHGALKVGE